MFNFFSMPDIVNVPSIEEPWREVFSIFEGTAELQRSFDFNITHVNPKIDFCGCSLEKAVSAQEIVSGNEEHIARV